MKNRRLLLRNKTVIINFNRSIPFLFSLFLLISCNKSQEQNVEESVPINKGIIESDTADFKVESEYSNRIEQLLQSDLVKEALKLIEEVDEETVLNQIKLTEIEAPPFKESKFGRDL